MPSSGREGYIGLAKQAAKGTGTAPTKFIKWTGTTDMSPKQGITVYREGGDSLNPGIGLKENHKPDGQFALLARPDLAGFLFAMALGADTVTGAGPYTHALTPAATLPWVTIERQVGGVQERIIDCRIKSITVEGESSKPVKLTVEYLGINEDLSVAAAVVTYDTDMPFVYFQAVYTWDGGGSANVEKFKVALTNSFDEDFFSTAVTRQDIALLSRDVELEATISMEDSMGFYKKVYAGTGTAPGTSPATGSFVVDLAYGVAAAARELKLDIPNVVYTEAPIELNADDGRLRYEIKTKGSKAVGSNLINVTVKSATTLVYV